jgi:hypothetical protein
VVSLSPGCFTSGKEFPVPIKWEAEWVPGSVSTSRGRHKYLVSADIGIPDFPVCSLEMRYVKLFQKTLSFYLQGKKAVQP